MSGYLLDTHVVLSWLVEPAILSAEAQGVIGDAANGVFVSAAAVWEMAIKKSLGRLAMPGNLAEVLASERIEVLDVGLAHALGAADLPRLHDDPFDRLQIAQARLEGLTILTRDERIRRYEVKWVLA